jgi:protein required for attachment to host cells
LQSFDSVSAHKRSSELGSDRPGRSFESATPARHGVEPKTDPHTLEKTRFADFVSNLISMAARKAEFERLVLVAPARVLAEIRDRLEPDAVARLVGELQKDLIKVPDHELQDHLREWLLPV